MFELLTSFVSGLFVKPNENNDDGKLKTTLSKENNTNWFSFSSWTYSSWEEYSSAQQERDMKIETNLKKLGNVDIKYPSDERAREIQKCLEELDNVNIDWAFLSGRKNENSEIIKK